MKCDTNPKSEFVLSKSNEERLKMESSTFNTAKKNSKGFYIK